MTANPIEPRRLLDPRPDDQARARPIRGAVCVPCQELPQRTNELPPREEIITVADCEPAASRAVAWLRSHGRRACVADGVTYAGKGQGERPGRLWMPTEFLADQAALLPPGRALELACGSGRDAVYLASLGWDVTAIDILPDALERGRGLERRYAGQGYPPVDWRCADLEREGFRPAGRFDLVTGFRFLKRPLFRVIPTWLSAGGTLLYETFTVEHRTRNQRPTRSAHLLERGELRALAGPLEIVSYDEAWRGNTHTARLCARRAAGRSSAKE